MAETRIPAEQRTEFGKGAARRIRRADKIPAVVYGHGEAPMHVTLPGHATMLALKHSNALLDIDLGDAQHLVLPKDVQRDPIRGTIEHVDLIVVRRGEKVTVDVPLHLTGEAAPSTVVQQELTTVSVETEATHIPDAVEVSVEGLEAGTQIAASDVTLPEGTTLVTDPEALVVVISAQVTAEQAEAELEALEAEAGIVRDEPTTDEESTEAPASDESSDS
ncbi:50S ribosomal protein L25/general stress protein Ctc [Kineococcus rubinsiae]|uniref:50S ribosomal protein L25/general stress protein Ctc n=1 Tax=Kineococcus rubinsiae TaxID=2609562 RepID=UPI001430D573|nr:50S ribosomal protein L25/general stress protein Ctc [Kineococcus rubinsiae]NIZ92165.1 50S ribosomal protein L25/general stress protein Ctc [Kineococcus rubinsiae]